MKFVILILFISIPSNLFAAENSIISSEQQDVNKAIAAADSFASTMHIKGSADYMRSFKDALNLSAKSLNLTNHLDIDSNKSKNDVAKLDLDERYRKNFVNLMIVGGKPTSIDNNNRMIGAEVVFDNKLYTNTVLVTGNSNFCTGTVIKNNIVLTAQHCVCDGANEQITVGTSMNNILQVLKVKYSLNMKPCGSPTNQEADIALLILDGSIDSSVNPAIIADSKTIDNARKVTVVGFGRDEYNRIGLKQFVTIPMASNSCTGYVTSSIGQQTPDTIYYGCNQQYEFVAGASYLNKDSCNGDSGGPAFVIGQDNKEYLAGATSRASSNNKLIRTLR